ncbi:hypothetical protein J5N97_013555 [Dioscorea zingiberensis]|uniref:AB hydrolase-1 domain-containing protein n=1 Tax=Dioscorea zingiberensis TaxID=325984 RepID=A0A9D5CQS9_9LILI|nr:hypothetical protein J5N97_013555 [Dioscorea zingiberensis]
MVVFSRRRRRSGGLRPSYRRWSDCGCRECVSWQAKEEQRLHFVIKEAFQDESEGGQKGSIENVMFIHGFLSSSSLWVETVFPNISETAHLNLLAVDLLGFGRSPKPMDCLYRLKDHLDMVEKSVIQPFYLQSFHLVAHSMGCIIALAFAAKHPKHIKSITLIAPPYFSSDEKASFTALNTLSGKKIWPPFLFVTAILTWYEHLGRTICFILCRNHVFWEWLLRLMTRNRDIHFLLIDLTRHTHHSAWHTMHNVICGEAKLLDSYLETVKREGISVKIIHGDKDQVIPLECSFKLKEKLPHAELQIIANTDHQTVILGREKDFTRELEEFWFSSIDCKRASKVA